MRDEADGSWHKVWPDGYGESMFAHKLVQDHPQQGMRVSTQDLDSGKITSTSKVVVKVSVEGLQTYNEEGLIQICHFLDGFRHYVRDRRDQLGDSFEAVFALDEWVRIYGESGEKKQ